MSSLTGSKDDEPDQEATGRAFHARPATAFILPRHVRWERQHNPETGEVQLTILDIQTGEIIAIVRSLFDAWWWS